MPQCDEYTGDLVCGAKGQQQRGTGTDLHVADLQGEIVESPRSSVQKHVSDRRSADRYRWCRTEWGEFSRDFGDQQFVHVGGRLAIKGWNRDQSRLGLSQFQRFIGDEPEYFRWLGAGQQLR